MADRAYSLSHFSVAVVAIADEINALLLFKRQCKKLSRADTYRLRLLQKDYRIAMQYLASTCPDEVVIIKRLLSKGKKKN